MDQGDYSNEINQIKQESSQKELTTEEYQTGPQHAAKLRYFQSLLTKRDRSMVEGINRMVREVHAQKDLGTSINFVQNVTKI